MLIEKELSTTLISCKIMSIRNYATTITKKFCCDIYQENVTL